MLCGPKDIGEVFRMSCITTSLVDSLVVWCLSLQGSNRYCKRCRAMQVVDAPRMWQPL